MSYLLYGWVTVAILGAGPVKEWRLMGEYRGQVVGYDMCRAAAKELNLEQFKCIKNSY